MITNDVSDSYQQIYVIAHIICNHPVLVRRRMKLNCGGCITILLDNVFCLRYIIYDVSGVGSTTHETSCVSNRPWIVPNLTVVMNITDF
jgi:hypothetical protein